MILDSGNEEPYGVKRSDMLSKITQITGEEEDFNTQGTDTRKHCFTVYPPWMFDAT